MEERERSGRIEMREEERCRRRGTPNWRCPERALPGKSHCLKHHHFYVSRRHRLKAAAANKASPSASASASVEPYRPAIDFDCLNPPVQNQTVSYGVNDQTALAASWSADIMSCFAGAAFRNGEIALAGLGLGNCNPTLGGHPSIGGNDYFAPGGVLDVKRAECGNIGDGVVFDGLEMQLMAKSEAAVNLDKCDEEGSSGDKNILNVGGFDHHHHHHHQAVGFGSGVRPTMEPNFSWVMRDKDSSESDNDDEDFKDQSASLDYNQHCRSLWSNNIAKLPTNNNIRNRPCMTNKKRGRPKGSKNKPKWTSL